MSVEAAWRTIHEWLDQHHPPLRKLLKRPATPAAFSKLEKRIGQTLPEDFKASYLIHNGSDSCAGVLVGLPLMSLTEIGNVWKGWAEIADDNDEDLNEECSSSPRGKVKERYANRGWIPFAGDSQNHVAIDYDPGPKGKVGQIINCGRDDEVRHVIADTFTGFMEFVARQFSDDRVEVNPNDARWLRVKGTEQDLLTGLSNLLAAKKRS